MQQKLIGTLVLGLMVGLGLSTAVWSPSRVQGEGMEQSHVFEMRTYIAQPGKLKELHARFRNHTLKLFEKHGMKNVVYLNPSDPKKAEDTLVYLISHASREAADESWKNFRADPEWIAARTKSEENGGLVKEVISEFFTPTDYSPLKK